MFLEKDDEAALVGKYGIANFPTIVWTDAKGETIAVTVHPEGPGDARGDLEVARRWLRGEPDAGE